MSPKRRYPTDLTDGQWSIVEPLLPVYLPRTPGGRPPEHSKREIVNAILYLARAGCAWRMLPKDLPPWQTVYRYFARWRRDGTLDRLHDALREQVRSEEEGRDPEPSAGIVDSQSVKGADTVSAATRGYDAGKRIGGRKRHIVVDTIGLLLVVMVTAASVQDRDGGRGILKRLHGSSGRSSSCSLTAATGGSFSRSPRARGASSSKSSASPRASVASAYCPAAGWLRERSPG
jgi:transposase